MDSLRHLANSLHIDYALTDETAAHLEQWDALVAATQERALPHRWALAIQPSLRSATVAGSTGIEGNPLTAEDVADVLAGGNVGDRESQLEVVNYNEAMDVATTLARRPDFSPEESNIQLLNALVTRGTPADTHGIYRAEPVTVADFYVGPHHTVVPNLMRSLVVWWSASEDHPLIRSALLHLNVAAIHPWTDGNGRTARILASLVMMRTDLRNPDVISLEPYFRANRSEYFDRIATTLGPTYAPDRHPATEWIEYYVQTSIHRLLEASELYADVRRDMAMLIEALTEADEPPEWAPLILASSLYPVTTAALSDFLGRSQPVVRRMLSVMARAGWLEREGRTRGTRYVAGERVTQLRTPGVLRDLSAGNIQLRWDREPSWTAASDATETDLTLPATRP